MSRSTEIQKTSGTIGEYRWRSIAAWASYISKLAHECNTHGINPDLIEDKVTDSFSEESDESDESEETVETAPEIRWDYHAAYGEAMLNALDASPDHDLRSELDDLRKLSSVPASLHPAANLN